MEILLLETEECLLINVYKSPGIEEEKFQEGMEFIYREVEGSDLDLIVTGYFNFRNGGMWTPIEMSEL